MLSRNSPFNALPRTGRTAANWHLQAHAFLWRDLLRILTCEEELEGGTFQVRKIAFKDMQPKRMNAFQAAGMDKHSPESRPISLYHVEQFKCRCAIKIASQLQVEAVAIPMHKDSEIGCHDRDPLFFHSGFEDIRPRTTP